MTSSADVTRARDAGALGVLAGLPADDFTVAGVTVNGVAATWTTRRDAATYKTSSSSRRPPGSRTTRRFTRHGRLRRQRRATSWTRTTRSRASCARRPRRRVRGQRADGRDGLVPEQQPPARQGDLRLPPDGAEPPTARAGNGELVVDAPVDNGNGTKTWNWKLDATRWRATCRRRRVGLFDYTPVRRRRRPRARAAQPLKLYDFIETALPATTKTTNNTNRRAPGRDRQVHGGLRSARRTRSTPTASSRHRSPGAATRSRSQTKSHFGSGSIRVGTLAHEIAHQWFGDSVGPATWREIWFNEGWATWWAQWWSNKQNGARPRPRSRSLNNYNRRATDRLEHRRRPTWPARGGPVRHVPGLHPARHDARGLPPDRRRHGVLRLPEGARRPSTPTARSPVTSSRRWPPDRGREGRLRGLQPGQARRVLRSSGSTAPASRR